VTKNERADGIMDDNNSNKSTRQIPIGDLKVDPGRNPKATTPADSHPGSIRCKSPEISRSGQGGWM
jgi:hypothetical protein